MLSSLLSNGQPTTPDRLEPVVPWWSFSKTVLAATALTLVRDGRVRLDELIPGQPFTLRQLLRHEAGLADYGELAAYHAAVENDEPAWPADDMLNRLDAARLRYSPGAGWGYSNVGYLFVARLIERLTERPLDQAVAERVLLPLGLANVRFARTRADMQSAQPAGTANYDPAWVYHGLLIGPFSQAAWLLDRLLGTDLLPVALLKQMQTARSLGGPLPGRPWLAPGYGLGVMQGAIVGGYTLCGHTGSGPGSVIAVYRVCDGDASACCAVFAAQGRQEAVEARVVEQLMQGLGRAH